MWLEMQRGQDVVAFQDEGKITGYGQIRTLPFLNAKLQSRGADAKATAASIAPN